jgi:hypothetical protein
VNTVPPTITLLGNGQLAVTPDGTVIMIHTLNISTLWIDPGVLAMDPGDGDITSHISKVFGEFGELALAATLTAL